ncbi:MAG: Hsp20/alpha crystallin family protein [Rhodobacterales bacterium]|nr:Hsp20/alpha crystallin family protein [Rhodobacterales bacterium]
MVETSQAPGFWPSLYEPFRAMGSRLAHWLLPASEASSDAAAYRIAMELPGVAEEDIHLSIDEGLLTLKGEKKVAREEKGETWYFSERQFGAFARSFRLPTDADAAGIRAVLRDGVLTVTVPKKPAAPATTRVPIARG